MTFTAWKMALFEVWAVFSRIRTECREIQSISPYSVWMSKCGKIWIRKTPNMDTFYGHSVSTGSEPVSIWVPLWDIHTKSRVIVFFTIFRVIISIAFITTLGNVGCYILLPASKVKMREKRQLFEQAGDDVRMRVTPALCGWICITALF